MSHVILNSTNDAARSTALHRWKWRRHPADFDKVVNHQGEDVLVMSSADRARQKLGPADKLYLGESYLFCHGNPHELVRAHRAAGGAVFEDGKF